MVIQMKIDRLISIIMILLERNKVSATKLAEMFEVTPRTIYRDIETINVAGIPIIAYLGVNGGISIMDEYKIEKGIFTISDISSLLTGLGNIHATISNDEILNTMAKIKGLIPEEHIKDIELKSKQIAIDYTTWFGGNNPQPNFEEIKTAIIKNKYITFKYSDRSHEKSQRKIEPYRLVLKSSNWYLQGYCTTRKDFRTFKLSRISTLELLNESFLPREFDYESLDVSFRTDKNTTIIKLLVDETLRDIMTELCGEEKIEACEDNKLIVYFPFAEEDSWYNMLLRYGDKCEILEPENVRLELIRRIKNLLYVYEKASPA